ncbi:MAG: hypothetical protein KDK34_17875, partial [Leptospiraceae bacterium]|nr:hypothetical protein [Leptospiraceae bacterium]
LIQTRAEHIKHTMRMVRLHKASEIVNAEIQRLRGVVEEKRETFDRELSTRFGNFTNEADIKARNAVYMRLAGQVEAGVPNFYNEFRAWYWNSPQWLSDYGEAGLSALAAGGLLQITPSQIAEGQQGLLMANMIPHEDRMAIAHWMAADGQLAEYTNFSSNYFQYQMAMSATDLAKIEKVVTDVAMTVQIVLGTLLVVAGTALTAVGGVVLALGTGLVSIGTGLLAGILTAILAPPFLAAGWVAIAGGLGMIASGMSLLMNGTQMITTAVQRMVQAAMRVAFMQATENLMLFNTVNASGTGSTNAVMQKQREYEEAQARLDYFTKVPDVQTLKERMVQFGAQNGDNDSAEALYQLSDEDLKYLFYRDDEDNAHYIDQSGNAQSLTAEEQDEALDLTEVKDQVQFRDGFGRKYDPTTITYTYPGPLVAGKYGGEYTRIMTATHTGAPVYAYAKLLPTEDTNEYDVFNMGDVLKVSVEHGETLREDRRSRYLAEGERLAGEVGSRFILEERDDTFSELFTEAAGDREGGREYTGYRMAYEDYGQNQQAVYNEELGQRVQIQLKEWELRERELQDRY